MGLQRIIKASSGAELTKSKMKLKLGDREEEITMDEARNAYLANPLAYKDTKDKELNEKALQIALEGLKNGTIEGTPGIDTLGNFSMSGSADIFNLANDPEQKELFKRVNQVVGNIAMQRYNSYKAPTEEAKKSDEYDYTSRAKTRGMQYSFFRNNEDAAYQLNHLTGKYQSGKVYTGALYDSDDKKFAQVDKYFKDIYDNEVLNKEFDSSKFGYNKDEFSKLYGEYNVADLTPEQRKEKAAALAMILGDGSNFSKIFNPLEYLGSTEQGNIGYGTTQEEPKTEYSELGNGMFSTVKDGKTYIGTKTGETFNPVTQAGTYGGYVVGDDGALVRSKIPEINDFASAVEFSNNPYLIYNGQKMNVGSPEYTNLFGNKDAKTWINDNRKAIYGDMVPSDELLNKEAEQLDLFRNKQYFNKPIQDLEQTVLDEKADRKLQLVNSKNNTANLINEALDNSVKQNVFDISDYFEDDTNNYFFTYKVNKAGKKERVIIKGKRKGNKIIQVKQIPLTSEKLSKLPFAKNKGDFMKRDYSIDNNDPETKMGKLWDMPIKRLNEPKVIKSQLGGNLIKQTDPQSINVEKPRKEDQGDLEQNRKGTKFKDIGAGDNTDYDDIMFYSGLGELASALTSFLPSTGITNAATLGLGLGSTVAKEIGHVKYGGKSTWDAVKDGLQYGALDVAAALPGVGGFAGIGKLKKAKGFYDKFLSPLATAGMVGKGLWNAEEQKTLDKIFGANGQNITDLTIEETKNLVSILAGIKRFSVNRGMKKNFMTTTKQDSDLSVTVKGKQTKLSLNPNEIKSLKESKNQVADFKALAAKKLNTKVEDIDFGNLTKDSKKLAFNKKLHTNVEELNFKLNSPSESSYALPANFNHLNKWQQFVARDGMQSMSWKGKGSFWGKRSINSSQPDRQVRNMEPTVGTPTPTPIPVPKGPQSYTPFLKSSVNYRGNNSSPMGPLPADNKLVTPFKNGGVLKFAFGGSSIFSKGNSMFNSMNSFNMEKPINKFGNKSWVANDVFVTRPEYASPGELSDLEMSPFIKQESPLDRFNKPIDKPLGKFTFKVDGSHEVTPAESKKSSMNPISYADVLDFTNLMYANKQTNNLKQYTNYKPALTKAPKLATPSVAINGIEESNARRRIAELNTAKPQYASAEQTLMGKYAANAQGNEMSRQIGQSISGQLEQKKEAYRQAVNQQSMIDADVANKNAAALSASHNMQLNAQGELAKTIFQNNSNYLTRMAQNQRMKDEQRNSIFNQKRALEYNSDPKTAQEIQTARNKVEMARQAAGNDVNNVAYRQAVMELERLIKMNELTTEAIKNGVIL